MEKKGSSFALQAVILAAAGLLVRFIGFIYRVPLTRLIGDTGNGIYGTGFYIYNFFLIVSSSGIPAAISKMVSERNALGRHKDAFKVFKVSLGVTAVTGTICMIIMFFGAEAFAESLEMPKCYYTILTLAPTVLIVAIMSSFRGYFQGMKTTVPTAISQIIEQIFNAVFSVWLAYLWFDKGIEFAAAGGTAGTGVGALAGLIFLIFAYIVTRPVLIKHSRRNKDGGEEEKGIDIAKQLIVTSATIIAGTAVMSVTNIIDMKMVMERLLASGAYDTEQATALYGQLSGKFNTLTTLPIALSSAFATATIPNISSAVALKDRKSVMQKINLAIRMTMLVSIPAAVGMGVLAEPIMKLLYGELTGGADLLKIGVISIILLSLTQIVTGILQAIGRAHLPVISLAIGAVVKIILNWFLIVKPEINVAGSVISTTVCYVIAAAIDVWALLRYTRIKINVVNVFFKPVIASAVMGIFCFTMYPFFMTFIKINSIVTILVIILAIILYFAVLLLIKGIKKEDIRMFPMGDKIVAVLVKMKLL